MTIEHKDEDIEVTVKYIYAHQNWSVEKQADKVEKYDFPLTECRIYQRGKFILLEHEGIIHYRERADTCYPYFQMAIELMELHRPRKWKTVYKLIDLRNAIRQTEVNYCGYVDEVLMDGDRPQKMTLERYRHFMRLARAQDVAHHGMPSF